MENPILIKKARHITADMFEIIKRNIKKITTEQMFAYKGMVALDEDINLNGEESPTYVTDIRFLLDEVVMFLQSIEDIIYKKDAKEFDSLCSIITDMNEIKDIKIGGVVYQRKEPKEIVDIDYETLSLGFIGYIDNDDGAIDIDWVSIRKFY
jgi:hypothetical protein